MGRQLKSADILGVLDEEPKPAEAPPKKIAAPTPEIAERKAAAERAGAGKPSAYESDLRAKLRDQVQFNFGKLPRFIAEGFEHKAREAGMNKREYLYHLLRREGVDIPPYTEMDGRKL